MDILDQEEQQRKEDWNKKGVILKALDYLGRPGKAVATAVDYAIDNDTDTSIWQGVGEGLSGQSQTTFSDVLEHQGVFAGDDLGSKIGRYGLGFALDVALDPTSYLTIGAGAGAKLGTMAASRAGKGAYEVAAKFAKEGVSDVMNETGTKIFQSTVSKVSERLAAEAGSLKPAAFYTTQAMEITAGKFSNALMQKDINNAFTQGARKFQESMLAQNTLRYMGKEIPVISDVAKMPINMIGQGLKSVTAAAKGQKLLKPFFDTADQIGRAFDTMFGTGMGVTGTEKNVANVFLDMKSNHVATAATRVNQYDQLIDNSYKFMTPAQKEEIFKAIQSGDAAIEALPTKVMGVRSINDRIAGGMSADKQWVNPKLAAKQTQTMLKHFAVREQSQGILENVLDNYLPHIYEKPNNPRALEALRNVNIDAIQKGFKHNMARTYHDVIEASAAGLKPVTDMELVMKARARAHVQALTNKKIMEDAAKTFGMVVDPAEVSRLVVQSASKRAMQLNGIGAVNAMAQPAAADAVKTSADHGVTQVQNILSHLYRMPEDEVNKLFSSTTEEVMQQLKSKIDGSSAKFVSDILPRIKHLQNNGINFKKAFSEGLATFEVPTTKLINGELKASKDLYLLPAFVKEQFKNKPRSFWSQAGVPTIMQAYDDLQNFWKGSMTVLFPAFHGRNALSNVAQNFQDMGLRAFSFMDNNLARLAIKPISDPAQAKMAQFMKVTDINGKAWNLFDIRKMMKDFGVQSDMTSRLDLVNMAIKKGPNDLLQFQVGRSVGKAIEDQARAMNFIGNLKRFGDPALAAIHTKKFLFDYGRLTDFEKGVMRRLVPFYTWQKKNIELMSGQIMTNFGKYVQKAHFFENLRKATADVFGVAPEDVENNLPSYMKDSLRFYAGTDANGDPRIVTQLGLPEEQFFNYMGGLLSCDLQKWGRQALSSMSRPVKIPIELITGQSLFTGEPIEKSNKAYKILDNLPDFAKKAIGFRHVTDKKGVERYIADPYALYFLQNTTASRLYSTAGKMFEDDMGDSPLAEKIIAITTGYKAVSVDIAKQKEWLAYEKKKEALDQYRKEKRYRDIPTVD